MNKNRGLALLVDRGQVTVRESAETELDPMEGTLFPVAPYTVGQPGAGDHQPRVKLCAWMLPNGQIVRLSPKGFSAQEIIVHDQGLLRKLANVFRCSAKDERCRKSNPHFKVPVHA